MSSGALPAAIAVVRISGPGAHTAAAALAGPLPPPRRAGLRTLIDPNGTELDRALVLVFPGPATATGEDLVELHLHGGRAVVAAVTAALGSQPGLRPAKPGEFTRRALANGRIDLTQAEGLADLLAAETEQARRAALAAADGAISRQVAVWAERLTMLAAQAEALIDFADEDDVAASDDAVAVLSTAITTAGHALRAAAVVPSVERLHDGIRVVFAGPPNAGKSSLVNALAGRDVAIATPVPGTTRDRIEVPVIRDGIAWLLTDVAGLRDATDDPVEAIGIARAREAMTTADVVVWLGDDDPPVVGALALHARHDLADRRVSPVGRIAVSAVSGEGLSALWAALAERAGALLPPANAVAFNARQRHCLATAADALIGTPDGDLLLVAEHLRLARSALATLTGADHTEAMLDALFGHFCIGK